MASFLFTLSSVCFVGAGYHAAATKRPGVYPPKKLLKNRAVTLLGGGIVLLIMGMIVNNF